MDSNLDWKADMPRLRRAAHFVPGASEKMLLKSLALPADALVLDLEDAVTPDQKDDAREEIAGWLRDVDFGRQERIVRCNPLDTPWGARDYEATMRTPPDAYLVPKTRGAADLEQIDAMLTKLEREHGHPQGAVRVLVIATETPQGLMNISELASAPRVDGLTWGAEDLSAALGATRNRGDDGQYLEIFRYARHMALLAACAAGVQPLDGVWVDVHDLDGLRAETREAAQIGFTGKMTIHPNQVEIVNQVLTPSADDIQESRELVAEFERHEKEGRMAFQFRGQMVDAPHLARARNTLDRARLAGVD